MTNIGFFEIKSSGNATFALYHHSGPPGNNDTTHRYKIRTHYIYSNGSYFNYNTNYNPIGSKMHVAYVYSHSERCLRIFVNGKCLSATYYELPRYMYNYVRIGWIVSYGNGHNMIDEFRITDGIAWWTSDFTPPTEPYKLD